MYYTYCQYNKYPQFPTMLKNLITTLQSYFPYNQKKAIQNWDFIFIFQQYYKGQIQIMFSTLKCQQQIQWTIVDNPMQKQVLFLLKLSDKIVIDMAHQLKILKIKKKRSYQLKLKDINRLIYTTNKEINPNIYNYLCFLRARMQPSNIQIYQQQKYSAFNKQKASNYIRDQNGRLFTTQQQLRAKYHFLLTYSQKIEKKQQNYGAQDTAKQSFNIIMKHPGFIQLVPIQKTYQHRHLILDTLKDSVSPNISCYFQFVSFLQKWLIFPMIIGLLTVGFNNYYDYTADNSPFDFIYALIIMLWSILFITRWEEIHKWMKVKQTGGRSQLWTQSQNMISKRSLQKKYSLVTGQCQYHLPLKYAILLRSATNLLCFFMMMLTLTFIIYSLNARGFIDPQHKLFYSQTVSLWASPGGIFDSSTMWGQVPNIVHVLVTNGFDQNVYRPLVRLFAKYQRHESRKGYENSIILKYFVYQFVITFADLFYIAFIRFDIEGLRQQLLSLFFIDIVRRVIAESVIPWARGFKQKRDSLKYIKTSSSNTNAANISSSSSTNSTGNGTQQKSKSPIKIKSKISQQQQLQWGAINQVNKQDYQPFDDYLQIITNMGYLIMISSCFPLAPLLILIAHQVQLIQDKYKVIHIFKCKLPQSYVGMGRWKNIIVFICYISIVTNIMLFAFSSQQLVSYFPKFYQSGKDLLYGNTDLTTLIGVAATGLMDNLGDLVPNNLTIADFGFSDNFINNETESFIIPEIQQAQIKPEESFILPQSSQQNNICNSDSNNCQIPPQQISQDTSANTQPTFVLKQFKPPNKQNQVTFMALLFFIEHFFLLLFIFIRDILQKRKSEADIFLQRRDFKRRIKKNLPKKVLDTLIVTQLVNNWIAKQGPQSLKQNNDQQRIIYPTLDSSQKKHMVSSKLTSSTFDEQSSILKTKKSGKQTKIE